MQISSFPTLALFFLLFTNVAAQNVLISDDPTATSENSAVLKIHSDSKGLLIPRITKAARTAIISPANGLIVFETGSNQFYFYNGTSWKNIQHGTDPFFYSGSQDLISNFNHLSSDFMLGSFSIPGNSAITKDMLFYDNSKSAIRIGSLLNSNVWSPDSIGTNSIGMGLNPKAVGTNAVSIGYKNTASGEYSTAFGYSNFAFGDYSTTLGYFTQSQGSFSLATGIASESRGDISSAFGNGTKADAKVSTAMGQYNVGGGNPDTWVKSDPLFEIGNGENASIRKNAMTVLKNGDFIVGSHELPFLQNTTDTILFFDRSKVAFRAGSLSGFNGWISDSIGQNSFAFGYNTRASKSNSVAIGFKSIATSQSSISIGHSTAAKGLQSLAMGKGSVSTGDKSVAIGDAPKANGYSSTSIGSFSVSNGNYSTAMGEKTVADSRNSFAIGKYNLGGGDPTFWIPTDPLFEIGNGLNSINLKNALTVLKNGDFIVGGHELPGSGFTTDTLLFFNRFKAAFRGGSVDNSNAWEVNSIGEHSFAFGLDVKSSNKYSVAIGHSCTAAGLSSISLGEYNLASGAGSFTAGSGSVSGGNYSIALGYKAIANGRSAFSVGESNHAIGLSSTAMGLSTIATGNNSSTFGLFTSTNSFGSMAIGQYNLGIIGNPTTWDSSDPVFVIGDGLNAASKSNSLTILKNGKIGLKTHIPQGMMHIKHDSNSSDPHLILEENGAASDYTRLKLTNTSETAYWNLGGRPDDSSLSSARFNINYSGQGDIVAVYGNGHVKMAYGSLFFGTITTPGFRIELPNNLNPLDGKAKAYAWEVYSDNRVKTNVRSIRYGLQEIMELRPVSYLHHSSNFEDGRLQVSTNEQEENIGFIAQEVYEVIQEIVTKPKNEETELWSMDYEKLSPVLVQAIQEQQEQIQQQSQMNQSQQARIDLLEKRLEQAMIVINELLDKQ